MTTTENTEKTTDEHALDGVMVVLASAPSTRSAQPHQRSTTVPHRSSPLQPPDSPARCWQSRSQRARSIPTLHDASFIPGGVVVQTDSQRVERGCFITPPTWNEALDGPLPRCYTEVR